jgi:hypothetical protein
MKNLLFILFAVFTLGLNSCSIIEEISFNNDNSGSYSTKIDINQGMAMMEMMMSAKDSTNATESDSTKLAKKGMSKSLDSVMQVLTTKYKGIEGLSNIKIDTSEANVYVVKFDFKNETALNEAMNSNSMSKKDSSLPNAKSFSFSNGKIVRLNSYKDAFAGFDTLGKGGDENEGEGGEGTGETKNAAMSQITALMTVTTIYHFKKDIISVSDEKGVISEDKKTVTIEGPMSEWLEKDGSTEIKINK